MLISRILSYVAISTPENKPYVVDQPATTANGPATQANPSTSTTQGANVTTASTTAQQQRQTAGDAQPQGIKKKSSIWARCCGSEKDYA